MNLRLPIAVVLAQFLALGAGVEACSGAAPFTNDADAGDDADGAIVDSGKRDANRGWDAGRRPDAWTNPEASTDDGGIRGSDADIITGDGGVIDPPGVDADIYCGAAICTSQLCCGGHLDGGVPSTYVCQNMGTSCTGVKATCDDMIDCPGKMCCATLSGARVTGIGCATSCGAGLRVCDPGVASDCASTGGGACVAMTQLPGSNQYYCQ